MDEQDSDLHEMMSTRAYAEQFREVACSAIKSGSVFKDRCVDRKVRRTHSSDLARAIQSTGQEAIRAKCSRAAVGLQDGGPKGNSREAQRMHAVGASLSGEVSRLGEECKHDVNEEAATKTHFESLDLHGTSLQKSLEERQTRGTEPVEACTGEVLLHSDEELQRLNGRTSTPMKGGRGIGESGG